ncbi:unnamed protein product [Microthlaspi erraticum]|uniref:Uncharacterized protein n=1 Tax=Microthlaspi erraticum TaxID=1685480 RepID=A0A6D2KX46_9BRAS|nr:unnamed protein product [Microthlaspi erraticum]
MGFKTGFGSTAALGRSVGTIGRNRGRGRSRNGRRTDSGRPWSAVKFGRCFSAGRGTSSRLGRMHRPWYEKVARPRGLFPARAAWSCAAGVSGCGLADRGQCFPGRVRSADGLELWPRLQTDDVWPSVEHRSRPAGLRGWALILDRAVWTVFTLLVVTPFLLIQIRPFQLRWKVNSIRARRELVLMKSIE